MKSQTPLLYLILFFFVILNGCFVIFEQDLSMQEMKILMPFDGQHTTQVHQTFWWEQVEGAIWYNIQILKPEFIHPEELIADTSIMGNKFVITLSPGEYEWCVMARNNFSTTDCIIHKLIILDTSDK